LDIFDVGGIHGPKDRTAALAFDIGTQAIDVRKLRRLRLPSTADDEGLDGVMAMVAGGSDSVTKEQLASFFLRYHNPMFSQELDDLMEFMDKDQTGRLDRAQFFSLCRRILRLNDEECY